MWQTIPELGTGLLIASLVGSGYAFCLAALASSRPRLLEAARRAALGTTALVATAVVVLAYAFVTHDFRLSYVSRYSDRSMSLGYLVSALWGGQDGSLLWWMFLLAAYSAACIAWLRNRYLALQPYVIATLMGTVAFFGLVTLIAADPFTVNLTGPPIDGRGLNPLLQNIYMIIHPPALYLGFVGCTIPYAFAMAALLSGRLDHEWVVAVRKWMLVAWLFLSLGNALGMIWAYVELGWGGYWAWDPVEISALIPWLTGTAYLHSMITQEKRGLFKHWTIALIVLTFCLVIFGTFLTRSGLLSSVHSFSESGIGPFFLAFIALMFLISLGLLLWRWNDLGSAYQIRSFFSKEGAFVLNNLLFVAIFLICLIGILFPIVSELVTGQKVTVGPPFYESATGPLFALLLLLMGVVPLTVWGAATASSLGRTIWLPAALALAAPGVALFLGATSWIALLSIWFVFFAVIATLMDTLKSIRLRSRVHKESGWRAFNNLVRHNRRRYGGYLIHIGVALMGLGIIGIEMFQTTTQGMVAEGESLQLSGYTFTYEKLELQDTPDGRNIAQASILISRDGRELGRVYPGSDYYYYSQQSVTRPGIRSTLSEDLYIVLVDWLEITAEGATFKVFRNPLINWLWIGTVVLILGTLIALWPSRERRPLALKEKA